MKSALPPFLLALPLLAVAACDTDPPELLELYDATPKEVEIHDTLVFRGAGFPPGETGLLELDGTLHQSGTRGTESFSFEARIKSETEERVVLAVDDLLIQAFTTTPEGPRHATFEGTATVSFAPVLEGAPPIFGKGRVEFDVFPAETGEEKKADAPELGSFYGAELRRGPQGLEVVSTIPEGRLALAGLSPGDQITAFNGLNAHEVRDLEPRAGQRRAELEVLRAGANPTETPSVVTVKVEGFRPRPAEDFKWTLALVLPVALWLLLSHSRWVHAALWVLGLVARRQNRDGDDWERSPRMPSGFLSFLVVSATFGATRSGLLRGLDDLDLALVYLLVATLEGLSAFAGSGAGKRFSLFRALWGLIASVPLQLTLALAFGAVVLERASLGLESPQATFGGLPGPWATPSDFLVCLVLLALAFTRTDLARRQVRFAAAVQRVSSLFLLGAAVTLFFGSVVPASESPLRAGVWFQALLTAAYLGWLWVQRTSLQLRLSATSALTHRLLLPAAALATVLAPVWLADVWPDWLRRSLQAGLAALLGTAVVSLIGLTVLGRRVRDGATMANPWL